MGFKLEKNLYIIEEFRKKGAVAVYGSKELTLEKLESIGVDSNKSLVSGVQTHSPNIVVIKEQELKKDANNIIEKISFPDTDGLITDSKEVILYTKHADCLALYFYDEKKKIVGLCHSGWRGSFEKIGIKMLERFIKEFNSNLNDITIGIGIGISQKNYEVSHEFKKEFCEKFSIYTIRESFLEENGKIYFDNGKFNLKLLEEYGIKNEKIVMSNECTYHNERLHSYRRDKEISGRNLAYIYM